jgi:ribonuclease HI
MRNASERRPNADLWEKLLELCEQHEVTAQWVKGHSGNKENERCDYLAETAARMTGLPPDPGYSS